MARKARPSAVRSTLRVLRANSLTSRSLSRLEISALNALCVRLQLSAARVKLRSVASAMKARMCRTDRFMPAACASSGEPADERDELGLLLQPEPGCVARPHARVADLALLRVTAEGLEHAGIRFA